MNAEALKAMVRENHQRAKAEGWCEQCTFPWYDGTCECGHWQEVPADLDAAPNVIGGWELYLLTCELTGRTPRKHPSVGHIPPVLDKSPEELEALWDF